MAEEGESPLAPIDQIYAKAFGIFSQTTVFLLLEVAALRALIAETGSLSKEEIDRRIEEYHSENSARVWDRFRDLVEDQLPSSDEDRSPESGSP